MPLTQNVNGTLKKITKLTQNVSGVLKNYNNFKQNVSGVLKEVFYVLPTILSWTTDVGDSALNEVTIESVSNQGLTVNTRIYNCNLNGGISEYNVKYLGKIYSNSFYLKSGDIVTITGSMSTEQNNPAYASEYMCLYNTDDDTIERIEFDIPYEVTTSGNYYLIITGNSFFVSGSSSGVVTYHYGYMDISANISFS